MLYYVILYYAILHYIYNIMIYIRLYCVKLDEVSIFIIAIIFLFLHSKHCWNCIPIVVLIQICISYWYFSLKSLELKCKVKDLVSFLFSSIFFYHNSFNFFYLFLLLLLLNICFSFWLNFSIYRRTHNDLKYLSWLLFRPILCW